MEKVALAKKGGIVNCKICNKQIVDSKDINIVALLGIKPAPWCNSCYSSRGRGVARYYLYYPRWFPINSLLFTIGLVVASIILVWASSQVLLGHSGTATLNGRPTELTIGIKLAISLVVFIALAWQWILWLIARGMVNKVKSFTRPTS